MPGRNEGPDTPATFVRPVTHEGDDEESIADGGPMVQAQLLVNSMFLRWRHICEYRVCKRQPQRSEWICLCHLLHSNFLRSVRAVASAQLGGGLKPVPLLISEVA